MNIVETLKSAGIIPVIVIEKEEQAVPLAKALVKGGLPVLEVTFRTKAAAGAIAAIKREVPEAIVGAGTILTVEQLRAAKEAGAVFGVAPGFDPVIMAAGTFVQGATTELSADGPIRPPYAVYMQGSLTYEHGKLALLEVVQAVMAQKEAGER